MFNHVGIVDITDKFVRFVVDGDNIQVTSRAAIASYSCHLRKKTIMEIESNHDFAAGFDGCFQSWTINDIRLELNNQLKEC